MKGILVAVASLVLAAAALAAAQRGGAGPAGQAPGASAARGLTAVEGISVGHFTLAERPTGCTVILVEGAGAAGGVSQRGGAPGTRETDLLDPLNMVDRVNAVVLAGGSAYGLDAAQGNHRSLEERGI
jgi:L-aminopeptidase/D-esterase-like protein